MLFRKKVKKKAGPIELTVDRESVSTPARWAASASSTVSPQ